MSIRPFQKPDNVRQNKITPIACLKMPKVGKGDESRVRNVLCTPFCSRVNGVRFASKEEAWDTNDWQDVFKARALYSITWLFQKQS